MEHKLESKKTFRYFTYGNPEIAKKIIYVLHGYGQLAFYFIRNFHELDTDFFIIAPEGMHRFYLKGSDGRVGASWMTKEAREDDISDTMNWLDDLDQKINSMYQFDKKIILGFSQGGATAARWKTLGKIKADHVILWASIFPPDLKIDIPPVQPDLNKVNYFVLGIYDEYFTVEQQKYTLEFYSNLGYNSILFEGKHTIDSKTLLSITNSL